MMFKRGRPSTAPRKARPNEKWCPGCKEFHSTQDFNRSTSRKDGLQAYCRAFLKRLREDRRVKEVGIKAGRIVELGGVCHLCGFDNPEVLDFYAQDVLRMVDGDTTVILLCRNCQTIQILYDTKPEETKMLRRGVSVLQDDKRGRDT